MENEGENRCANTTCGKRLLYGDRVIAVFDTEMGGPVMRMGSGRPVITADPESFCSWSCFCAHYREECAPLRGPAPSRIP